MRSALVINAVFVLVELAGAAAFHSLALFADSAHQCTDMVALGLALVALRLIERPGSARHTFGLQRAEVLAALANGCLLAAAAVWIAVEAVRRLQHPVTVHAPGVLVVAGVGLVANALAALLILRAEGRSVGMSSAAAHLAMDAVALLATLVAAALVAALGWHRADSVASLLIGGLVVVAAWRILAATVHVLLEGTPAGMDPELIEAALLSDHDVAGVHHLHLWSLASDVPALSAHVVLAREVTLHEAQERADQLKDMLAQRFGIDHATLELECHECEVPDDTGRLGTRR